jgi:hypothetical protein
MAVMKIDLPPSFSSQKSQALVWVGATSRLNLSVGANMKSAKLLYSLPMVFMY